MAMIPRALRLGVLAASTNDDPGRRYHTFQSRRFFTSRHGKLTQFQSLDAAYRYARVHIRSPIGDRLPGPGGGRETSAGGATDKMNFTISLAWQAARLDLHQSLTREAPVVC
jgi:hypothetical protein